MPDSLDLPGSALFDEELVNLASEGALNGAGALASSGACTGYSMEL